MANPRPKKKTVSNGKQRRNLRLDADLDKWLTSYAKTKHTSATQVIIDCLLQLRKTVEDSHVEQI